jgi:UDP-N-acetylglucosamine 2-epimerase (non-hydrolysing)
MTTRTILICVGTRPEIIKMAPVYHALRRQPGVKTLLLHTAQHDVLAEEMYRFFDITPDYRFEFTRQSQTLGHLLALMMDHLDNLFDEIQPDVVMVQGDTCTALAGALCGFYSKSRVAHVEAGLRTFNAYEPFPEEKNRELIARLAQWHFAPTLKARHNLEQEHIAPHAIYEVGNTIVDAVNLAKAHLQETREPLPASLLPLQQALETPGTTSRLVLVTAHRRESWDGQISNIAEAVFRAAERFPDLHFVWPVHPNPVVKNAVYDTLAKLDKDTRQHIYLCDPLGYPALIWLLQRAWIVLTDSGGIQEESLCVGVPVLVLRDRTERPEVIDAHGGVLVGTQVSEIVNAITMLHDDQNGYDSYRCDSNPFGDGHSAERIIGILTEQLGVEATI